MGLNKLRYSQEKHRTAPPLPAHGGLYRLAGDNGYYWVGQGPRPAYRPTLSDLTAVGIDPVAWIEAHRKGPGVDLPELARELERSPQHAPRLDSAPSGLPVPGRPATGGHRRRDGGDGLQGRLF